MTTLTNKVLAVIFVLLGYLSMKLLSDGTFLAFTLMLGVPLFLAKEDVIF